MLTRALEEQKEDSDQRVVDLLVRVKETEQLLEQVWVRMREIEQERDLQVQAKKDAEQALATVQVKFNINHQQRLRVHRITLVVMLCMTCGNREKCLFATSEQVTFKQNPNLKPSGADMEMCCCGIPRFQGWISSCSKAPFQ